jgi:hypothetical protein
MVEHVVPPLGMEIVPVTLGAGLTPGDAISVEPRGIPVGPTAEPVPVPNGDVAPMEGVGLAIPLTCAMAALQTTSAGKIAAINDNLIWNPLLKPAFIDDPERALATSIKAAVRLDVFGQSRG